MFAARPFPPNNPATPAVLALRAITTKTTTIKG
jgi:hypothetical protein